MKRLISLFSIVAIGAAMLGCSGSSDGDGNTVKGLPEPANAVAKPEDKANAQVAVEADPKAANEKPRADGDASAPQ